MSEAKKIKEIKFSKYHGCGNSFVIIAEQDAEDWDHSELAVKMCREQTGIGADGLIIVRTEPELEMLFYNRDGSRAPMCGNGIRCFAKYCFDNGVCKDRQFAVKTLAGDMIVDIKEIEPFLVEINMGKPIFEPEACAIKGESEPFLKRDISLASGKVNVSSIFMGTIHTILWTDDLESLDKVNVGSAISNHETYTEKTNVNMVQVLDRGTLKMQTYERGVGMTLACGTGACASAVIAMGEGRCDEEVDVVLPLGTLHITKKDGGDIMMRGPAVKVAEGKFIF